MKTDSQFIVFSLTNSYYRLFAMTNNIISSDRLKNRRNVLKKQRQWRIFICSIRILLITSLFGSVFWLFTSPRWVLSDSKQIEIEGNNLLTDDEIRSLVDISYPKSLLQLSIDQIRNDLEEDIPVRDVIVTKKFIPPGLQIQVTEKKPIAVALAPRLSPKTKKVQVETIGYIDEDGKFISSKLYQNLKKNPEQIPKLKITGNPQIYLAYWSELYNLLTQSQVEVKELNWQNPANLILTTDLGKVHLGSYTSKFAEQLMMLEKLKIITQQVRREDILYIDLTDPQIPSIKKRN